MQGTEDFLRGQRYIASIHAHGGAQCKIGYMFECGLGVTLSLKAAFSYYCNAVANAQVPRPCQRTGGRIEGADHARRLAATVVVDHPTANDDVVARDQWRRALEVESGFDLPHALLQIDDAAAAEIGARLAGLGIQFKQTRVNG